MMVMPVRKRKKSKCTNPLLLLPPGDMTKSLHNGYCILNIPGYGQIKEHRYVMEKILGRKLRSEEHVHHIDRDRSNNHPDNLKVMSKSEHATLHGYELKGPRKKNKNKKKYRESNLDFKVVPSEKLPSGFYFHRSIGIAEKQRKTK